MSQSDRAAGTALFLIVLAGCLLAALSFGIRASFGLFLEPISATYGWGREIFALALAIQNLLWGLGQPFAGAFADRYGTARVLAIGGFIYACGVALMAVSSTPGMVYLTVGLMIGIGIAGASFSLVLAAFVRLLPPERRGWALGLGTAAGSFGQLTMVPIGQGLLSAFGWQDALFILAAVALTMVLLAAALRSGPAVHGVPGAGGEAANLREALKRAYGSRSYRLLVAGFFVCGFHIAFIQTHFPAFISDMGLPAALGASTLALVGGFNIIGSYSSGMLSGRFSKRYLLSAIYFLRSVVIVVFISLPVTEISVYAFGAAMGLLWLSTVPPTSGLVAVMFGTRYMATLFGIVFLSHQVGAFLGAWIGGWAYDHFGNYELSWWLGVGLGLFAAIVHLPIQERAQGVPVAPQPSPAE